MIVTNPCLPLWLPLLGYGCTAATYNGGNFFDHSSAFLDMKHIYPNLEAFSLYTLIDYCIRNK